MSITRIVLAAVLTTVIGSHAQGYYRDVATQPSRTTAYGQPSTLITVPYANVRVYTSNGLPAVLYTDSTQTQRITQPVKADAAGRYSFYVTAGSYLQSVSSAGGFFVSSSQFTMQSGGGGSTPTAATPTATPTPGPYSNSVAVSLSSVVPNSFTFYTLDGSTPTVLSTPYTGTPISLSSSATIRALTIASGYINSALLSAAYTVTGASNPMTVMPLGANKSNGGFIAGSTSDVLSQDISAAPLSPLNAAFQTAYGAVHPDMDPTMSTNTVNSCTQTVTWTTVHVGTGYPTMQVPLTGNEQLEGQAAGRTPFTCWQDSSDGHLLVTDVCTQKHWDFYNYKTCQGQAQAYSGYVTDYTAPLDTQNAYGFDSTNAAGTVIRPGLYQYDQVVAGVPTYANRMTLAFASNFINDGTPHCGIVPPATHGSKDHCTGNPTTTKVAMPYAGRLRLKASKDISALAPEMQNIAKGWKKYGTYFDDTNSPGQAYMTLVPDSRWNVDHLAQIKNNFSLSDFEMVQVNGANPQIADTNDDDYGSDSVLYSYTQTDNGNGTYTPSRTLIPNPTPRPSLTATASATTVALGGSVTLSIAATNADRSYFDEAPPLTGSNGSGSVVVTPLRTTTYTPYARNRYGLRIGTSIAVTVTGPTVADPVCTPASGQYTSAVTVSCSTSTSGASIYYTQDGTVPGPYSTLYTAPFQITTTQNDRFIAIKSGMLDSNKVQYSYQVNIAGATPQVLGSSAPTGYQGGQTSNSVSYNFVANDAAVCWLAQVNTTTLPTVTIDGSAATLLGSFTPTSSSPTRAGAIYYKAGLSSGSHTCNASYSSNVNSTMVLSEVAGTSGLDAVTSSGAGASANYPTMPCGTLTTMGPNRRILFLGEMPNSQVNPNSGTQLFQQSGFTGASLEQATAGSVSPSFTVNNNYGDSGCVAIALKP